MAYKLTIQIDYNIYKATRFSIKDVHSYNYLKNSISDDSTFSIQKCVEDKSQLKFLRTELLVEWLIILLILTTACFFTEYDLIYFLIFDCILGVIGLIISTYNYKKNDLLLV